MLALANHHNCKQFKGACLLFMASPEIFTMNLRPVPLQWGASMTKDSRQEEEIDPS
jgi:hypothetical protein